jgi:ferredoxin
MIYLILLGLATVVVAISLFAYGLTILFGNVISHKRIPQVGKERLSLSIDDENLLIEEGVLLNTLWAHLPEADCKEGECGGCRVKLLKGDIEWIRKPIYQLVDPTHILPCSCKAKTSLVCDLIT